MRKNAAQQKLKVDKLKGDVTKTKKKAYMKHACNYVTVKNNITYLKSVRKKTQGREDETGRGERECADLK